MTREEIYKILLALENIFDKLINMRDSFAVIKLPKPTL
jgi:hypothetical protein